MRVREFSCVLSVVLCSSCAVDYLNHYDTVTLAAGDASHANMLLQTVDPFNPNSDNTHIEGDGTHAAAVVLMYRGEAANAAVVPTGGADLDCAGGKGNNPVVPHGVTVSGSDPNGLDRDHDGIG